MNTYGKGNCLTTVQNYNRLRYQLQSYIVYIVTELNTEYRAFLLI